MMRTELNIQPETTLTLDSGDELSAILDMAQAIATQFQADEQTLKSSILASEVQTTTILKEHIVLTHGSDPQIQTPLVVQVDFTAPILWGSVATQVDQAQVILVPSDYSDREYNALKAQLTQALNQ
ncbi:MAG: PTS sugar transporter subunit IIA [Lactobacillus sp.]|nr:PTS sugar transporter subunit IIA [Lactobacillus sp.]